MSIQEEIARHKAGQINFLTIGRPQFICASDDDYIDYIEYCWEYLAEAQLKLLKVSFLNDDDHIDALELVKEVSRAHGTLELCHKFLRKDFCDLPKNLPQVYTTIMGHNRN